MNIAEIYEKLGISPNLQEHMLRVTSVSLYILQHWNGPEIQSNTLQSILLLHDVGNIVKFDLQKNPEFLGDEIKRIDYWTKRQAETVEKYGTDDHEATMAMLEELGIPDEIRQRIYGMSYWDVENVKNGSDWYLKIALYSDLRVGPFGILTLQERLDDLHTRLEKYRIRPELIGSAKELENHIKERLNISVDTISNETIFIDRNLLSHKV